MVDRRKRDLVAKQIEQKIQAEPREILAAEAPHPKWWEIISRWSKSGQPHFHAAKEVMHARIRDQSVPMLQGSLDAVDSELPALSQGEALAILNKFLIAEKGELVAGVSLYPLQWLTLTREYAPFRERYEALRELTKIGILQESHSGIVYASSDLKWPLVLSERCVEEIEVLRIKARLPTFAKVQRLLANVTKAFPSIAKINALWRVLRGV